MRASTGKARYAERWAFDYDSLPEVHTCKKVCGVRERKEKMTPPPTLRTLSPPLTHQQLVAEYKAKLDAARAQDGTMLQRTEKVRDDLLDLTAEQHTAAVGASGASGAAVSRDLAELLALLETNVRKFEDTCGQAEAAAAGIVSGTTDRLAAAEAAPATAAYEADAEAVRREAEGIDALLAEAEATATIVRSLSEQIAPLKEASATTQTDAERHFGEYVSALDAALTEFALLNADLKGGQTFYTHMQDATSRLLTRVENFASAVGRQLDDLEGVLQRQDSERARLDSDRALAERFTQEESAAAAEAQRLREEQVAADYVVAYQVSQPPPPPPPPSHPQQQQQQQPPHQPAQQPWYHQDPSPYSTQGNADDPYHPSAPVNPYAPANPSAPPPPPAWSNPPAPANPYHCRPNQWQ